MGQFSVAKENRERTDLCGQRREPIVKFLRFRLMLAIETRTTLASQTQNVQEPVDQCALDAALVEFG
jgi:hypothetical protein